MIHRFDAFVSGITACYKYIQKIKSYEMTEFGLKGTHAMILFHLRRNPEGLTAAELSSLCAEDKAAVSRTVSELVEKGYVDVHRGDQSKKKYRAPVVLTKAGEEMARHVDQLVEQWVSAGGDGLTDEERSAFYHALDIIAANLKTQFSSNKK